MIVGLGPFFNINRFFQNFFHIYKYLKILQLVIIKKAKKIFLKSLVKDIKNYLEKEKVENEDMVGSDIRISQKLKSKDQLSIEKHIKYERELTDVS